MIINEEARKLVLRLGTVIFAATSCPVEHLHGSGPRQVISFDSLHGCLVPMAV